MRSSTLETRRLIGLGLLAGLVLAGASAAASASADDTVVSSSPYNGQVVTKAIDTVTVSFSDALMSLSAASAGGVASAASAASGSTPGSSPADADGFAIEITDADGGHHESGCVRVDGTDASTDVALGESGEYTVAWKVVSQDGQQISGRYSFTWQPSAVTMAAPAFDASPACGDAWSGAQATRTDATDQPTSWPQGTAAAQPGDGTGAAIDPEPTMTILSAVPAVQSDDSGLAVPIGIVAGVGILAALSGVLFYVVRRAKGGAAPKP